MDATDYGVFNYIFCNHPWCLHSRKKKFKHPGLSLTSNRSAYQLIRIINAQCVFIVFETGARSPVVVPFDMVSTQRF